MVVQSIGLTCQGDVRTWPAQMGVRMGNVGGHSYEERVILFLDFLGFKEIISQTENDEVLIDRIVRAIDHLKVVAEEEGLHNTLKVTQFSDSIVVSYAVNDPSAVFWLINNLGYCVVDLTYRGFLLRGAVTVGPLLHTSEHLFGPAMVKAYELESKVAKYPRVIVDEEVFQIARQSRSEDHDPDEEEGYVKAFLRVDEDGQRYLDYISWSAVVATIGADFDSYCPYLERISALIKTGITHKDRRVREKYLWLYQRYLEAIAAFEATPEDFPGRIENPEIHDFIVSLPRFVVEVDKARNLSDA